ncbi:MAG: DegT/DnrJ/EryC1/StrS family aminotransferase [Candidatus Wildermuthbacteria bacterium]|nr:DegT/DnrJ/EryC1/StrS family aminotransferase [Candidatus Wildermuthbacteria bacterium]
MKRPIPYGHQWIEEDDIQAVVQVLKSDWLTQGPAVVKFEKAVAAYCGAKYAVAVSSGTAALHAACKLSCRPVPVFCDIQSSTLTIDPKEIEKKITRKTKAIIPVDFRGCPADLGEIMRIAKKHKLLVIEDASHSIGSEYRGKKVGSIADMTVFSFHPVKTITTGEGGMVMTNSKDLYEKIRMFRHHGVEKKPEKGGWYYEIQDPGYNYRITDMQCALGLSQLKKIKKFIQRRAQIVREYDRAFKDMQGLHIFPDQPKEKHAHHLYVMKVLPHEAKATRKQIFDALKQEGIGVQVHYMPLHLHPFYKKKFGYKQGNFPVAEAYYQEAITLPLFPRMTKEDVRRVIAAVAKVITRYRA